MRGLGKQVLLRTIKILNVILVTIPFAFCWLTYYSNRMSFSLGTYEKHLIVLLFSLFYIVFARTYDAFLISYHRISEIIFSQVLSTLISDFFGFFVIGILTKEITNILPVIIVVVIQILIIVGWTVGSHRWYFISFSPKKAAIIHEKESKIEDLISEYGLDKKFDVKHTYRIEHCKEDFSVLDGLETVFITDICSHDRNMLLKYCVEHGITMFVIPKIGDVVMSGATRMHMFHLPMLRVGRYSPNPEYLFLKRCFDIIISGSALVILSPIMLLSAFLIWQHDKGPVFYKQKRLTKDGKEFEIIKFRSMKVNAEADGNAVLSSGKYDSRITPIGRIIRKYRIDELPQLFNILEGSMSIVGPRPERPEIAEKYEAVFPEFHMRLQAKAGLTGYAQVYGKYNTSPYNKLKMDLMYISHPSILEDLHICFATVKILFSPESTEGVGDEQKTAMKFEEEKRFRA